MVIYFKMMIKISLNTNTTVQSNVTNNNNVFCLQINVQCKQ